MPTRAAEADWPLCSDWAGCPNPGTKPNCDELQPEGLGPTRHWLPCLHRVSTAPWPSKALYWVTGS